MSIVDNIFFLHGLITHYLNRGKKLFCAFVYFTKAFNYVMHDNLWFRLVKLGLRGNTLKIVKSMYEIVKSRVKFCEKNWKRILLFTLCKARRMFISCFVFYVRFFSKFYRRHSELVEKYNVSLRKLLQQGISEPESYGDLVYRISNIVGNSNFSEQFGNLINRYKRIGYNPYVMRQTACLVINPTSVDSYASLFNCTTTGRASDSMTAST